MTGELLLTLWLSLSLDQLWGPLGLDSYCSQPLLFKVKAQLLGLWKLTP